MRQISAFLSLFWILWFVFQCNHTTLVDVRSSAEKPTATTKTYSYVLGYFELGQPAEAICPEGKLTKVEIKRNVMDSIIHFLIGGIVTSRTQDIYCE